jgi:hypothetical protein
MSIKESVRDLFKPKEIREAEQMAKLENALRLEEQATVDYLTGKISLEQYNQVLETTFPITKIDLRKLASELNWR